MAQKYMEGPKDVYVLNINNKDGPEGPEGDWFSLVIDFEQGSVHLYRLAGQSGYIPHGGLCGTLFSLIEAGAKPIASMSAPGIKSEYPKLMGTLFLTKSQQKENEQ